MSKYRLKCKKNTESKNLKGVKSKSGKMLVLSKCTVCYSKASKSIK